MDLTRLFVLPLLLAGQLALAYEPAMMAGLQGTADTVRELARANDAFSEAYVRGDAAAMAAMYAEDAILLPPGRRIQGREEILRFFTPSPQAPKRLAHKQTAEDRLLQGDVVIEAGRYTYTVQRGEEPPVTRGERHLIVWARQKDGSWKIRFDIWHSPR